MLRAPGALDSVDKYVIRPTSRLISSLPFSVFHIFTTYLIFLLGQVPCSCTLLLDIKLSCNRRIVFQSCYDHDSCLSPVYKHAILILVANFPHDAHKSHRSIVLGTSVVRSPWTHSLIMLTRNLQNRPHRDHQPTDATSQFSQHVHANRVSL